MPAGSWRSSRRAGSISGSAAWGTFCAINSSERPWRDRFISNYRKGIPNGVMGLLGHLINMDNVAYDLVNGKYAYRRMPARYVRIGIPVLWIYGQYDKWIDVEEVADLMSVNAGGGRELLEIPTGHNLRTSNDAIQTFKLITGFIYEKLHGERIVPVTPPKKK